MVPTMVNAKSRSQPKLRRVIGAAIVVATVAVAATLLPSRSSRSVALPEARAATSVRPPAPALSFVENRGQADASVVFESRGYGGTIALRKHDVILTLPGEAPKSDGVAKFTSFGKPALVRMSFLGARDDVRLAAGAAMPGRVNYLIGQDEASWLRDLPTFGGVHYSGLYDGIDLTYDGTEGRMKGTFTVAPGVDPGAVRWRYEGVERLALADNGDLALTVLTLDGRAVAGRLVEEAPVAWQDGENGRTPIVVNYKIDAGSVVSFEVGDYDRARPLIIDPTVLYRTLLGGNGTDHVIDVKVDSQGFLYSTGRTHSNAYFPGNGWPLASNMFDYAGEIADAFITKLDPTGSQLVYSTYIGSGDHSNPYILGGSDWGIRIDVNTVGEVAITGLTEGLNYPVTSSASRPNKTGIGTDAFVSVVSADGQSLLYSSYIGGSDGDFGWGVKLGDNGELYVAGYTASTDFSVTPNCYQPANAGSYDGFVAYANLNTGAAYASYFGFPGFDEILDMHVANGKIYVCGISDALLDAATILPPNVAPAQPLMAGIYDGFMAIVNPASNGAADLEYFTFLGGTSIEEAWAIDVDALGAVYVGGITGSLDYPMVNSLLPFGGFTDGFVTKVNPQGGGAADIVWSQVIGVGDYDRVLGLDVDASFDVYVCGIVTTPYSSDSFVARLSPFGQLQTGELFGDPFVFDMALSVSVAGNYVGVGGYCQAQAPEQHPSPTLYPTSPSCFQYQHGGGSGDGAASVWSKSSFFAP